jgi:hypothetical protein
MDKNNEENWVADLDLADLANEIVGAPDESYALVIRVDDEHGDEIECNVSKLEWDHANKKLIIHGS